MAHSKKPEQDRDPKPPNREDRLADALRKNLKRRKAPKRSAPETGSS